MSKMRQARAAERRWARGHQQEQLELQAIETAIVAERRMGSGLTWSKTEKAELADQLMGAIVHVTAAAHGCGADGVNDRQRQILETQATDVVLWSLDLLIERHRECLASAVKAAKHLRSIADEFAAQNQDGSARQHDDAITKLGYRRRKVETLGIPAEVIAAVDKRIPRLSDEVREGLRREEERVQAEQDRIDELFEKFLAAERAAGHTPNDPFGDVPAEVTAIVDRNVVWDDALMPDGQALFSGWLARRGR